MAGQGKTKKRSSKHCHRCSSDSIGQVNPLFFNPQPMHSQSQTWKSEQAKEREQFERKKNLLKHIAPEQFRNPAKPSYGPCEIVPRNYAEWVDHQNAIKKMQIEEMRRKIAIKEARINAGPDARLPIKSVFTEKKLNGNLSAVLSKPTVWSNQDQHSGGRPRPNWPCSAELQWNGDSRENNHAKTRCGRFLPPLRVPGDGAVPFSEMPIMPRLLLDQTGYRYDEGPPAAEFNPANMFMDNDPQFEQLGRFYLGNLMEDVGEWAEAFVPDWLAEQKTRQATQKAAHVLAMVPYGWNA